MAGNQKRRSQKQSQGGRCGAECGFGITPSVGPRPEESDEDVGERGFGYGMEKRGAGDVDVECESRDGDSERAGRRDGSVVGGEVG